jgi:hypothetical protein
MTRRSAAYTFLAFALGMLYWGCPGPVQTVDLGGSEVVGKTVAKSGAAIPNAKVIAFKQEGETFDSVAVDTSDSKGQFTFTDLDTGTYRLYGLAVQGDTLVGLKTDVVVDRIAPKGEPPARVDAGDLTLLPKGWISGTVIIDKADMAGVLCYTRDSAFIAVSDTDGSFTIPRVVEGTYTVCFFYPGYEPKRIEGISVVSGSGTRMDTVFLDLDPDDDPNPPRNLKATYDTVNGAVSLHWNRVRVSDLREYILYRKNSADAGEPSPVDTLAGDTMVVDTIFKTLTDTVSKSLFYQVRAVDSANNKSIFSDPVTIIAVPPSTVRPVVRAISPDTVVDYGDTVRCRISFINAFNDFQVFLMQGSGSQWVPIPHSDQGIADTAFTTGTSSTWGSVRFRIKYSADSLDTFFTVHVRPRPVAIVSADSTDSTIVLRWNRSPDPDFKEYAVHRIADTETVIFRSTDITDTTCTYQTLSMARAGYWVTVADTEGVVSVMDSAMVKTLCIVNTPPSFTTNPAALPDSAMVGEEYSVVFAADDRNSDSLSFALLSPASALMNGNALFWTPAISELGAQRCTVTVHDNHGGLDTLAWTVGVLTHGSWFEADSLIGARRQCGIAEINGIIYATGGSINKVNSTMPMALKTIESYNPAAHAWVSRAPLVNARWAPFVGAWNGKLYVMGGFSERSYSIPSIEEYDPIANTWTVIGQMPSARANGASCVFGDKLYCLGGKVYDAALKSEVIVKTIDIFDFSTKTWSKGPDMLFARADHQALLCNGKICIIGGYGGASDSIAVINNEEEMVGMVEWYDPQANRCDSIASLSTPRCNFAAAALGDSLFIMGGYRSLTVSDGDVVLRDVELLRPSARWNGSSTELPVSLHSAQAISIQGRIFCVGGVVGTTTTRRVLVFYP